nr:mannose-1-phosphate guanylyltransferase [Clostridium paraputrificum]
MLTALIMAGGKGTRFWPLSTEEKPKQFLNLIGNETMIQMTINRIKPIIPIERIFVCTCEMYVDLVKEQLPELPERNIIVEPEGRNTAPCIALSAFVIKRYYNDATMLVLPSDHLIKDEEEFINVVKTAYEFVESNKSAIITLGMKPSRPEIGYGYIKYGAEQRKINSHSVINVETFVEKPNMERAEEYLSNGSYLWNGGMFLWSTDNILEQIKKYSIDTYEALHQVSEVKDEKLQKFINNNYGSTESTSIDYAVLEKSKNIFVIPSDFGWDDVGSWEAFKRYKQRDDRNNIVSSNIKTIESENNIVINNSKKIIMIGICSTVVIENDDKLFIVNRDELENLKEYKSLV